MQCLCTSRTVSLHCLTSADSGKRPNMVEKMLTGTKSQPKQTNFVLEEGEGGLNKIATSLTLNIYCRPVAKNISKIKQRTTSLGHLTNRKQVEQLLK